WRAPAGKSGTGTRPRPGGGAEAGESGRAAGACHGRAAERRSGNPGAPRERATGAAGERPSGGARCSTVAPAPPAPRQGSGEGGRPQAEGEDAMTEPAIEGVPNDLDGRTVERAYRLWA